MQNHRRARCSKSHKALRCLRWSTSTGKGGTSTDKGGTSTDKGGTSIGMQVKQKKGKRCMSTCESRCTGDA